MRLISSAENHVGEDRTGQELELPAARLQVFLDQLGAGDVAGHQVGRELDALERQVQRLGQRADQQRLGQAGHAHEQGVAAGEDGHQDLLDHFVLADDDFGQLVTNSVVGGLALFDGRGVVG